MPYSAEENVFILNLIEDNEANVHRLKETYEKFRCIVKVYEKPTRSAIKAAASEISKKNFVLFEYIVVIVLDKHNKSEDVIRSSDDHIVMLQSELLSIILENTSLAKKKILFLVQTNRNYPSEEDDLLYKEKVEAEIRENGDKEREQKIIQRSKKFYLYATEPTQPLPQNGNDILFIQEFCNVFSKFGGTYTIRKILRQLIQNLENIGYSARPTMEKTGDCIFGYALDEESMKDFFPDAYRSYRQLGLI